jgi:hypothetical protein
MISGYLNFNQLYFILKLKETLNHVGKTLWMYLVNPQCFFFFRFDPLHMKENTCDKNIMIFFIGTNLSFKNSLWHKGFFFTFYLNS